jgi:hypothetical protein
MRNTVKRATAGAALGGSLFFTAGLAIAFAQPDTAGDGLVNLSLGSAGVLEDVKVVSAVEIAAAVCSGIAVPQTVTATATATGADVDASGTEALVCNNNLGAITISQNGLGQSEEAPGIAGETPTSPTTTTTTTTTTTEEGG